MRLYLIGFYYLRTRARTSWISNVNRQVPMWSKNYIILQPQLNGEFPSSGSLFSSSLLLSKKEKRWGQVKYRISGISLLIFSSFPSEIVQILTLEGSNKTYSFLAFGDKGEIFPRKKLKTLYFKTGVNIQIVFSLLPVLWRADAGWWPALPPALPVAMAAPQSYLPSHKHMQKLRKETQGISHLFNSIPHVLFLRLLFPKNQNKKIKNQASWLPHIKKMTWYYLSSLLDGFYLNCCLLTDGIQNTKATQTHIQNPFSCLSQKKPKQ